MPGRREIARARRRHARIARREMSLLKKSTWMVLMLLPLLASAQRLPYGVSPQDYNLTFIPDFQKAVFAGDETIDGEVNKATKAITLNAVKLEVQEVTVTHTSK